MNSKRLSMLIKSLRLYHWSKNILLIIPLMVSHKYTDTQNLLPIFYAFMLFNMTASGVYLFNDVIDRNKDRLHPLKKFRGIASGELDRRTALTACLGLIIGALSLSILLLPINFTRILAVYIALTTVYTLKVRSVPILDVLLLSSFYILRLIAGASAIEVVPSFWLLNFSFFIFLSLALMKRYNELKSHTPINSKPTRGYRTDDIPMLYNFGISTAVAAILVLCQYINDEQASIQYKSPLFIWLACPVLFYWIVRSWLISHRGEMDEDTLLFAIKDRASLISAGLMFAILSMAKLYE